MNEVISRKEQKMNYKIIADTREKSIHVIDTLRKQGIEVEREKLFVGDYAIQTENRTLIPVVVERKANAEELLSNLTDKTKRFYRELDRALDNGIRVIILVEDGDLYKTILTENYRNNISYKAARGLLYSLEAKYPNVSLVGIDKELTASYINSILYYQMKEFLKEKRNDNFNDLTTYKKIILAQMEDK